MATPADKLAQSLAALKALQDAKAVAIRASDLTRVHRERLLKNGFIREVMKGWYIPVRPDGPAGESTDWYASFWPFSCARHAVATSQPAYCTTRRYSTCALKYLLRKTSRLWTACASCACPRHSLPARPDTSRHTRSRCGQHSP